MIVSCQSVIKELPFHRIRLLSVEWTCYIYTCYFTIAIHLIYIILLYLFSADGLARVGGNNDSNLAAILGGVIGGVVLIILIVILVVWCSRRESNTGMYSCIFEVGNHHPLFPARKGDIYHPNFLSA